ncbi:MAG: hypothetical protein KDI37_03780 [Xanthomonadales bacterium]|nr:hypothetical protein [Xanthomonadales bacterium]MCB1633875.1 hypothetical protein [Xanthomonadales bacterium]MCB1640827.1 hypothetical protein [Xanthomonadales bacterium]
MVGHFIPAASAHRRLGHWIGAVLCLWAALALATAEGAAVDRARQARAALAQAKSAPDQAEPVLMGLLLRVQQAPPDLLDRPWLEMVAAYQPQLRKPHDHSSQYQVALYPVDVLAKGQLNRLTREAQRQEAVSLLGRPDRFVKAVRAQTEPKPGYFDAIEEASDEQCDALLDEIHTSPLDQGLADLLGELAMRREDDTSLVRAISMADPVRAAHWLAQLQHGAATSYERAVKAANKRADLQPQVAALAASEAKAGEGVDRETLLRQLADPIQGAAAILPLARGLDSAGLDQVRSLLLQTEDPLLRRRLLLVLQSAPPALATEIAELTRNPELLMRLDQETRAWLLR